MIVNLHSGRAFRGILWAKAGPLLELRHVTMVEPAGREVPVDGAVILERREVEFYNVEPEGSG